MFPTFASYVPRNGHERDSYFSPIHTRPIDICEECLDKITLVVWTDTSEDEFKMVVPVSENAVDYYACECGNKSDSSGFVPCDLYGNEIEPTKESSWQGIYVCLECGKLSSVI